MVAALLTRGLIVGLCAGLLAGGFGEIAAEPQINRAIAFENHRIQQQLARVDPHAHVAKGPVSRSVQRGIGLFTATGLYGVGFGGIFALAFAVLYGRVGRARPARAALEIAATGFLVVILVPFLKYPANPPSVGNPDTITHRTELYLAMIAISVLAAVAGLRIARTAATRWGASLGPLAGVATYLVLVVGAALVLPGVDEVPPNFPAVVLWRFRIASLGTQLVLWTTIGLGFGVLAERVMAGAAAARRRTRPARTL